MKRLGRCFRLRVRLLGFEQILQLGHEFLNVLKIQVDRGKPYVRDFVVPPQSIHDQLADFAGLPLSLRRFDDEGFRLVHDLLELADRDWPLFARPQQAIQNFLAVKFLPAPVLFHHHVRDLIDTLVGGEALLALQALPAAADRIGFFALARIHDLVVGVAAKRTFHDGWETEGIVAVRKQALGIQHSTQHSAFSQPLAMSFRGVKRRGTCFSLKGKGASSFPQAIDDEGCNGRSEC